MVLVTGEGTGIDPELGVALEHGRRSSPVSRRTASSFLCIACSPDGSLHDISTLPDILPAVMTHLRCHARANLIGNALPDRSRRLAVGGS